MGTWYYQASGKEIGPLKSSEIISHIRQGRVTPTTLVRKNDSQWVAASEVSGLLEAAGNNNTSEYICPFCGEGITKPPVRCPHCSRDVVASYKGRWDKAEQRKAPVDPEEAQQRREQAIAEIQAQANRRDIWVYSICLVLWLGLLIAAPYLLRLCDEGVIALDRHAMAAILGVVGIAFAVTAYWLTRPG